MKQSLIILIVLIFLYSCHNSGNKVNLNKNNDTAIIASATLNADSLSTNKQSDSATAIKNQKEYMTPGKEHQMLASLNGTWLGEASLWSGQGSNPIKFNLTSINKMVLGGRYQTSTEKGIINGMSFEGINTIAFDNAKKLFMSTWIDNLGTGIILLEGPWNETTKSITLTGTEVDPVTRKDKNIREVLRIIDNERQIMQMFEQLPDGKEFKTMELMLTRKR